MDLLVGGIFNLHYKFEDIKMKRMFNSWLISLRYYTRRYKTPH